MSTYTILHVDSSPLADRSVSRKLTAKILAELKARHPEAKVIERDLALSPLPHLSPLTVGALFTPPEQRTATLAEAIRLSDEAVDEVLAADVVVIGAPMHNFGIPSSLKAWIDHIVRAGRTFQYGASGPVGLVSPDKKAIVVSARGGVFSEGPLQAMDYQETYLATILRFIGFSNIAFVRAEGIALGPNAADAAIRSAEDQVAAAVRDAA